MILLFKNYLLVEVMYLLIRFSKSKFFPWNTNSTEGNGVNKQNTHTHTHTHTPNTQRDNTGKGRGKSKHFYHHGGKKTQSWLEFRNSISYVIFVWS